MMQMGIHVTTADAGAGIDGSDSSSGGGGSGRGGGGSGEEDQAAEEGGGEEQTQKEIIIASRGVEVWERLFLLSFCLNSPYETHDDLPRPARDKRKKTQLTQRPKTPGFKRVSRRPS
jgi:hypothetical protein